MTIDTMNPKALRELRDRIDAAITRKQAEAKRDLAAKFRAMADEAGLPLAEILSGKSTIRAKHKRNPMKDKKTGAIWAGAGRYPKNFDWNRAEPV